MRFSEREREMIERGGQGRQRERHDTGLCREKGQVWEDTDRADLRPRTIIRLIRVRCCTVRALPQRGGKREGRGRVNPTHSVYTHTHTHGGRWEGGESHIQLSPFTHTHTHTHTEGDGREGMMR